jgi:hypothetical protein
MVVDKMNKNEIVNDVIKPSCEYCKHGHFFEDGDGWNEPRYIEFVCDKEDVLDEKLVDEFVDSTDCSKCPEFEPIMVEKCGHCKKPLNIPLYQANYVCNIFGELAFCSKECMDISDKEFLEI